MKTIVLSLFLWMCCILCFFIEAKLIQHQCIETGKVEKFGIEISCMEMKK